MNNQNTRQPPWKPRIISFDLDPRLYAAYVKASKDPLPKNSTYLRKALNSVLERFPILERQLMLQRLQYLSACERDQTMSAKDRKHIVDRTLKDISSAQAKGDDRSHDLNVLKRQKALLQRYVYGLAPYPKRPKDRDFWIKKHAWEMWDVAGDRCICEEAPWSLDILRELSGSSAANVIDTILAKIHRISVSALQQWLKPSRSNVDKRSRPLTIEKAPHNDFQIYESWSKRNKSGPIEKNWISRVAEFVFFDDGEIIVPITRPPRERVSKNKLRSRSATTKTQLSSNKKKVRAPNKLSSF